VSDSGSPVAETPQPMTDDDIAGIERQMFGYSDKAGSMVQLGSIRRLIATIRSLQAEIAVLLGVNESAERGWGTANGKLAARLIEVEQQDAYISRLRSELASRDEEVERLRQTVATKETLLRELTLAAVTRLTDAEVEQALALLVPSGDHEETT